MVRVLLDGGARGVWHRRAHVFYKEKVATPMLWLFPCGYISVMKRKG